MVRATSILILLFISTALHANDEALLRVSETGSRSTRANANDEKLLTRFEIEHQLFSTSLPAYTLDLHIQELGATRKSPALAALYSLLVPGLGEHYAEGWAGSGKFFSGFEGLLWLGFAGTSIYGNSLRDDALAFAAAHAGVNLVGKDDQFLIDVGNFNTTQEFNEVRLRDREPERLYDVTAGFGWRWDSDANRNLYRDRRISGEDVLNNRKFIVTAIIVNHLASAINAARLAIAFNKTVNEQLGELQLKANIMGSAWNPHGVMLTVTKSF
jgi:hypothetical protein